MKNLINKVSKNALVLKESFKAGMVLSQSAMMFPTARVSGIEIYRNNEMCLISSGCLSTTPMACAGQVNKVGGMEAAIFINDAFSDLEKEVQDAILAHEVGHIVNGDVSFLSGLGKNIILWKLRNKEALSAMERAADKYAENEGHNIRTALLVLAEGNEDIMEALEKQGRI